MSTPELFAAQQSLTPGARVELYKLDLTPIGATDVYYFTISSEPDGSPISFAGQVYSQAAINITGIERTATGETPQPKVVVPNYNKFAAGLVVAYGDMVGAELTRIVTFEQFLDGKPMADGNAMIHYDLFVIEQKLNLNNLYGEFALRVLADTGDRLVGRPCFKDICLLRYRRYNADAASFDVSTVRPCPYAGDAMFTVDGEPTVDPEQDVCSNDDAGCSLRYPVSVNKPFGGFPGMSRTRAG